MKISAFYLKLFALIAMTVDHVGAMFFPGHLWMRLVGRLAMPVFCFFVAEGFRHTKDVPKYMLRLFLGAVLSMGPYYLAFGWTQNVLFSLLFGLIALFLTKKVDLLSQKILLCALMCLVSTVFLCDWYFVGVILVVGFYYAAGDMRKTAAILFFALLLNLTVMLAATLLFENSSYLVSGFTQFAALLALPLLGLYDGTRGPRFKWSFYVYYPAHLLALWGIDRFIL